ncbi:MAG: GrpB family protein [Polyangiaceae bacterium]
MAARSRMKEPPQPHPQPYVIELVAHDPTWSVIAIRETERLRAALGPVLLKVHHIGSTAIPTVRAKPIIDLVPVVGSLEEVDAHRGDIEALGYVWWGEMGIAGRRYCIRTDSATGRRVAQLHIYAVGAERIVAHLAFRDYLLGHPEEARAYEAQKMRAQALHVDDVNAYNAVKESWMRACIERAVAWQRDQKARDATHEES